MAYTDGSGREGHTASGVYSEESRGSPNREYGTYLLQFASVGDAERSAILLVLDNEDTSMPALESDSMPAIPRSNSSAAEGHEIQHLSADKEWTLC